VDLTLRKQVAAAKRSIRNRWVIYTPDHHG
jgi:hypothetical protein